MVVKIAQESHERNNCVRRSLAQLTEDGLIGLNGRLVVHPAELVLKNVPEAVRDRHRDLAGKLAQEKRGKVTTVAPIHVQCMAVGVCGVPGHPVVKPVVEA